MFRPIWPSSGVEDVITLMFLKESASLVFFCILHVVTLLYVSICVFLFYFYRFILLFLACVFICLQIGTGTEQENTYGNVQKCNHMQDTEKTSEADSFKNMRVITSYTYEDGHIGRNM
jgi:hypothetical protein